MIRYRVDRRGPPGSTISTRCFSTSTSMDFRMPRRDIPRSSASVSWEGKDSPVASARSASASSTMLCPGVRSCLVSAPLRRICRTDVRATPHTPPGSAVGDAARLVGMASDHVRNRESFPRGVRHSVARTTGHSSITTVQGAHGAWIDENPPDPSCAPHASCAAQREHKPARSASRHTCCHASAWASVSGFDTFPVTPRPPQRAARRPTSAARPSG